VGVLETLPSKLADRALPFCGRSALEELMASKDSGAWVRLTELVLGPVPEGFKFLPKHKANATAAATSADAEANG
jgi:tRNA-dihydrouridine synthase 3